MQCAPRMETTFIGKRGEDKCVRVLRGASARIGGLAVALVAIGGAWGCSANATPVDTTGDAAISPYAKDGSPSDVGTHTDAPGAGHATDTGASAADSGTPPTDDAGAPPSADAGAPPPEDSGAPPSSDSGSGSGGKASADSGAATDTASATYETHLVTWYGWPDNSPPGPGIAYPTIHSVAGGTGTYADPITFATDPKEFAPGTILYVPFIEKYVIMEDACAQCITDWSSGKRHIDIWMNSDASHGSALLACQDGWTRSAVDVEISPPPDRPVTTPPLFDTSTGVCRTSP